MASRSSATMSARTATRALLAALVAVGMVASCGGCARRAVAPPPPIVIPASNAEPITMTEQEASRAVELEPGQQLIVRLEANRTTGYGWALAPLNNQVLIAEGPASYETAGDGAMGAGGTEVWRLRAVAPGVQDLRFEYRRPFEPGVPPLLRVSYAVSVR